MLAAGAGFSAWRHNRYECSQDVEIRQASLKLCRWIELKSLILAQIERWRHALHMQVERQRGGNPGGERRTGE